MVLPVAMHGPFENSCVFPSRHLAVEDFQAGDSDVRVKLECPSLGVLVQLS